MIQTGTEAPQAQVVPVESADSAAAELILVAPPAPRVGLLWLPALGVPARNYRLFADALAAHGVVVALHEWRGTGSSALRASREHDWGYRELLELDLPASMAAARAHGPDLPWLLAGHSLGGQIASLFAAANADTVHGVFHVASGAPYWRTFPSRQRWLVRTMFAIMPMLVSLLGRYPGRRFGFAGNEARTVMRDWARTGRTGVYRIPGSSVDFESAMQASTFPLLGLRMRDDRLCPRDSFDSLLGRFSGAPVERITFAAEDFTGGEATHFSWMSEPAAVAAAVSAWVQRHFGR